ncbi:hypothetical protein H5410_002392 [Solanum commersonii]|uniref:Alliinase C-terminal domain-containing protein n=1 Tax=Solanum commersonii TaxID=4109 RepID=A0A9J6B265_SOLCO|nr:hypothetical protein H5410_002392 [Solanum commersonii]
MYESYWRKMGKNCDITFNGDDSLSYFANGKILCWFLESKLEEQIKRLHNVVGNAIVDDHYIVVGTGSSQLVQAALYALSPSDQFEPIYVVSATPFYSVHAYPDVKTFEKYGPYIELITSPNNPDGIIREPVVNEDQGILLLPNLPTMMLCSLLFPNALAMLVLELDKDVARKMTKFMEIIAISVSKEGQLRVAKILKVVFNSYLDFTLQNFFEYSQSLMTDRWQRLRQVVMDNDHFQDFCESHPGGEEEDCEKLLKEHKNKTRSGRRFGSDSRSVRLNMLSRDEDLTFF